MPKIKKTGNVKMLKIPNVTITILKPMSNVKTNEPI